MTFPSFAALAPVPVDSYDAYAPVSVWRALCMRSNLQLLIAAHSQVRVHVGTPALVGSEFFPAHAYYVPGGANGSSTQWSQEFVHSWIRPEFPVGLDITVRANGTDDVEVNFRLVPANTAVDDRSVEALIEDTEPQASPGVAFATGGLVFFDEVIDSRGMFEQLQVTEDSVARLPQVGMLRLEVTLTVPAGEFGWIQEIVVKEFPCL